MAAPTSKEYTEKIIVNLDQLRKIQRAQRVVYDKGIVKLSSNELLTGLGAVATVLGLIFVASTPAGVLAGVTGIVSGMSYSQKNVLQTTVYNGYWQLGYMDDFMVDNPQYSLIEIELPFLEYNVNGSRVRFVSGKGLITRVRTSGGWILA